MDSLTDKKERILENLFEKILQRKELLASTDVDKTSSYTVSLFNKGIHALNAKVEEEANETIEAALALFDLKKSSNTGEKLDSAHAHLIHELADVFYHLLALAAYSDVSLQDIKKELYKRSLATS